ncbi:MAG: MlaD family protein [Deltaproteobacteria bacterium]|jgi:phospholipid/cholesterol/gamma-HCH transport system substrate-binding protein|nr:MlaD family protein [Deltaproteobacteria bacterium]
MPHNIPLKVGLFIVITSLMIISFIGYVAYKKGFFAKEHTYTLSSKSGENLTEGMPVVFSGFKIGRVDSMELNSDGLVIIKIKVPDQHIKWIRAESIFILEKPLIGSARIYIATANLNSPPLPEKVIPRIVEANDINEAIKNVKPFVEKINTIADNIQILTSTLAEPDGDMNKILSNAKDITRQIDGILKKVDTMAVKTDERIYGKEGVLLHITTLLKDMIVKLKKLDPILDNMNKISADTADTTKDMKLLRKDIDSMVNDITGMVNDIDKLIPFKKETQIKLP